MESIKPSAPGVEAYNTAAPRNENLTSRFDPMTAQECSTEAIHLSNPIPGYQEFEKKGATAGKAAQDLTLEVAKTRGR